METMISQFSVARRCGFMADAMVSAKIGPQARFFSRERVDEIVLLLREAEKKILDLEQDLRAASHFSDSAEREALWPLLGLNPHVDTLGAAMKRIHELKTNI